MVPRPFRTNLVVLSHCRTPRWRNYPPCMPTSEISILRKVFMLFLLASFPGRCGFLRGVLSSSVFMNGLFTVSWTSDRISLLYLYLDYSTIQFNIE